MNQFEKAGLIDVIGLTEPPPAYTFHADSPYERIDYIWTSSDITIHEVTVIPSIASDHLAIMATIDTGFKN
jgi:endonuclease/exonuclease/phosphatase family metal-dependent hydrolase